MARKQIRIDAVLEFAATARGRSTVLWAAIAFAVCHVVVLSTDLPTSTSSDALEQQLIHFGAVLCRFVLPFAVLAAGLTTYISGKLRESVAGTRSRFP